MVVSNFALIADMKLDLKRTPSTRMRVVVVVVVALMNLIELTYPRMGVDGMHDEDILEAKEVIMDKSNKIYE